MGGVIVRGLVKNAGVFLPSKSIRDVFIRNLRNSAPVFSYKGYLIYMAYNKNDYLRLSCNEKLLDVLIPLGNEVMESNVIASYLMDSDDIAELIPTVEWDRAPERRHQQLRESTNLGFRCINLQLVDSCSYVKKAKSKRRKTGLY